MAGKEINLHSLSDHKSAPKYTISARIPPRVGNKGMPGPGQYAQTNSERDKWSTVPKWTMSSGGRDTKEWGSFPGPGKYGLPDDGKTTPKYGFGSEPRLHGIKESRSPGPGAYEVRGKMEGVHYSVASRPGGKDKASNTPGPGQYKVNYDQLFESSGKISFGASSRGELAMSKTPGPGQYASTSTLCGNNVFKSPARCYIAGKRAEPAVDVTPGPGAAASMFTR